MNDNHIMQKLDEIQKLVEHDSYILTRDDIDSIFYRTEHLKEHIKAIYNNRTRHERQEND